MGQLKSSHVFSYSQLSSFDECPYSYYLQRIEKVPEILSNPYSERGTLIHDLLDQWAKGKITKEQMPDEYDRRYGDEVVSAYPPFMATQAMKKYKEGREFLETFDEFKGYKVVSAEEAFTIDMPLSDGTTRPFTGIVDLILRKEWTNELIICDHKSKTADGFKKAEKEMWKQQYLYSQYVFEKYGEWPNTLMFHLFGDQGSKHEKPFDLKEYREAIQWATDRITAMERYTIFDWMQCKDSSDFYCQNLCGPRSSCPRALEKPLTKAQKKELELRREEERSKLLQENSDAADSVENVQETSETEETVSEVQNNLAENNEEVQETVTFKNGREIKAVEKSAARGNRAKQLIVETKELFCECGEPYVQGKRKCPKCKAWYKTRI